MLKKAYLEVFVMEILVNNNGDEGRSKDGKKDNTINATLENGSPDMTRVSGSLGDLTLESKKSLRPKTEFPWSNRIIKGLIYDDAQLTLNVTDMDKRSQELLFLRNVLGTAVSNLVPDGSNALSDALFSEAGDELESAIQPTDGTKKLRLIGKTPKLYLQLTDDGLVVHVKRPDKDKNDHWSVASQSEQGEITLELTSPKAIVGGRQRDRIKKNGPNGTITLRFACQPLD